MGEKEQKVVVIHEKGKEKRENGDERDELRKLLEHQLISSLKELSYLENTSLPQFSFLYPNSYHSTLEVYSLSQILSSILYWRSIEWEVVLPSISFLLLSSSHFHSILQVQKLPGLSWRKKGKKDCNENKSNVNKRVVSKEKRVFLFPIFVSRFCRVSLTHSKPSIQFLFLSLYSSPNVLYSI